MAEERISSSELASFGEVAKIGTYTAVLEKIDAKESDKDDRACYVTMTIEFKDGENEGLKGTIFIFPKVTKSPKNGKYYSRGLYEAQQYAANWGQKLPDFDLNEFMGGTTPKGAKHLQKMLGDSFRKAGTPRLKVRVIAEKMQEQDPTSGKWVDKKDPGTGEFLYRNKIVVLGRADNASPQAAGATAPVDTDGGGENEEPASLTFA